LNKEIKVLFLGDIVGRMGRNAVKKFLSEHKGSYDFVIANVENASHGFGLTKKNHDELSEYGIDCMTSGNHIWDKKDIFEFIDESPVLIRPLNYHASVPGVGFREFNLDNAATAAGGGAKIIVLNLMGRTFMNPIDCPFVTLENFVKNHDIKNKIVIVDFHAEATAEKACMARFASNLGISAVLGTHTHIQTADEEIINDRLAFVTDVGFCGGRGGVIGMDYDISIHRLITSLPERFDVVKSDSSQINAVELIFDSNGLAKRISRLSMKYEEEKGED